MAGCLLPTMRRSLISKAAGKAWRALGDAGRAPFFAEYDKLMNDYMQNKYPTNKPRGRSRPAAAAATRGGEEEQTSSSSNQGRRGGADQQQQQPGEEGRSRPTAATRGGDNNNNSVDHATVTDSFALREQIVELERKLAQQHQSDSEVADLKQMIEQLLFQNKELQLKLKDSMLQRLDHLEEELLDFDKKLHEEVPQPCASEEAMSVNVQHHRIMRSSVLAAPRDAVDEMKKSKGEDSHPAAAAAAAARKNAGRNRSLQVGEPRPAKRAATSLMVMASQSAAGSRVSRQRQPAAASTRKTRGWVW